MYQSARLLVLYLLLITTTNSLALPSPRSLSRPLKNFIKKEELVAHLNYVQPLTKERIPDALTHRLWVAQKERRIVDLLNVKLFSALLEGSIQPRTFAKVLPHFFWFQGFRYRELRGRLPLSPVDAVSEIVTWLLDRSSEVDLSVPIQALLQGFRYTLRAKPSEFAPWLHTKVFQSPQTYDERLLEIRWSIIVNLQSLLPLVAEKLASGNLNGKVRQTFTLLLADCEELKSHFDFYSKADQKRLTQGSAKLKEILTGCVNALATR